jgi:hypothetical protein
MVYPMEWASPLLSQQLESAQYFIAGQENATSDFCKVMAERGVTNIFTINRHSLFTSRVSKAKCLRVQYHQDRVQIFELRPSN